MGRVLTSPGAGATLQTMTEGVSRRGRRGQTTVEYLLMMMCLVTCFSGMYGFLQGELKKLYKLAAIAILRAYY